METVTSGSGLRAGAVPADSFGARLMLARMHAGHLSIRDACIRTGLNRGNWQGWERGMLPRDILGVSGKVADALGVDQHWLLFGGPLHTVTGGYLINVRPIGGSSGHRLGALLVRPAVPQSRIAA